MTETADAPSTRDLLIDTAEAMFAERGIEGVALRAIGAEAGQSNSVAVQYYFKNRRGLIEAILTSRLEKVEVLRGKRLAALVETDPDPDLEALVSALQLPLLELNSSNTFARFLLHYLTSSNRWEIQTGASVSAWISDKTKKEDSPTLMLLDRIAAKLPDMPRHVLGARIVQCMRMLMGAVVDRENARTLNRPTPSFDILVEDQVSMIAAALRAPISETYALEASLS